MTRRKPAPKRERPQAEPSEYDRFEDLAKKLVKVPKNEIDEQRQSEHDDSPER